MIAPIQEIEWALQELERGSIPRARTHLQAALRAFKSDGRWRLRQADGSYYRDKSYSLRGLHTLLRYRTSYPHNAEVVSPQGEVMSLAEFKSKYPSKKAK